MDLEAKTWSVKRTRIVVNGRVVDSAPKTSAGRRSIPLDDKLLALLQAHRVRHEAEKLAAGPAYEDNGWLVADELGRPYSPDHLSKAFNERVSKLGLSRIRLHDLRHSAASLMQISDVAPGASFDMVCDRCPVRRLGFSAVAAVG